MNQKSEIKRLADATAALAATIAEIVNQRLSEAMKIEAAKISQKLVEPPEPLLTRKEAAAHFKISARTMATWLDRRWVPHYRIGRNVRIRMGCVSGASVRTDATRLGVGDYYGSSTQGSRCAPTLG